MIEMQGEYYKGWKPKLVRIAEKEIMTYTVSIIIARLEQEIQGKEEQLRKAKSHLQIAICALALEQKGFYLPDLQIEGNK